MKGVFPLKNSIQNYFWGSREAISSILGRPVPSEEPEAELWMGTHPKAPSQVLVDGRWISLPAWIRRQPGEILGRAVADKFQGQLPFLFKILAAEKALSIQVHPGRSEAAVGFKRENELRLPIDAFKRNYRDPNHKPEILCALTEFWALCGFRAPREIASVLGSLAEPKLARCLEPLGGQEGSRDLPEFFRRLMELDRSTVEETARRALAALDNGLATEMEAKWVHNLVAQYPGDIGVLAPLYLNLLKLDPGQAVFLGSGVPHSYLGGVGVELMANSDNVLRGGLTPKHIDVPELLRVIRFEAGAPEILNPVESGPGIAVYRTPASEFELSRLELAPGHAVTLQGSYSAEILICLDGAGQVLAGETDAVLHFQQGHSFIVPASSGRYTLEGVGILFRASVPAA